MTKSKIAQCARAVTLFRGLYARVARDLEVDVSYVSRIAHGERKSKVAENALTKEFCKVVAVMKNGSARPSRKRHVAVTLMCPRCKTPQKVHVAVRSGFGQTGSGWVSCISCDYRFKVRIPDKIIRGPFPA
jgi:hypothetical protein